MTDRPRCTLCGGNVGTLPQGRHNLCAARWLQGLATPSLGEACVKCDGRGWWRADGGPQTGASLPVYFNPVAMERGMRAIFPPCPDCNGKGYTGGKA
jgi:hypothetical protein